MTNKNIIIYTTNDGKTKIDVKLEDETLWLTQAQMCELYQTSKSNVSEHIKNIFEEGELSRDSVVRKFWTTATDGKDYMVSFYNLDMIIALGYRIRSIIATRFRQFVGMTWGFWIEIPPFGRNDSEWEVGMIEKGERNRINFGEKK